MPSDPNDDLESRIKAAREEFDDDYNPKPPKHLNDVGGANVGYEFLAYVISGGLVGYLLDRFVDIAPWGILLGLIFGLVGGVYRANDRMKQKTQKSTEKTPDS